MNGLHYYLELREFPRLLEVPWQHLPQLLHVVLADVGGVHLHNVAQHHHVHPDCWLLATGGVAEDVVRVVAESGMIVSAW